MYNYILEKKLSTLSTLCLKLSKYRRSKAKIPKKLSLCKRF
jgi:hypothetical protein